MTEAMGYISYIIAVEEVARIDGSQAATLAAGNSLGIAPIYYFGNDEQKKKWLPDLCAGKALSSFGLTEPNAGSDAGASKTTPMLEGNEWVINGSKIFITNSTTEMSRVCVVQAVTGKREDGRKISPAFLCPTARPASRQRPCTARWSGGLPTRANSISRTAVFPRKIFWADEATDFIRCSRPSMAAGSALQPWASAALRALMNWP